MQVHPPDPVMGILFGLWGLLLICGLLGTIFWIVELVDVARREFPDSNTKVLWLLVVLLSHGIGALVYYFVGKRQGYIPGAGNPPQSGSWQPTTWQRPPYQ